MLKILRNQWTDVLAAILLYTAVIVYQGYQYGQGDQSQILPCLYAQDHPGTYAQDHYVSQYLKSEVNERTIFHFLFRYLGYGQPWIVFMWHALFGISLILAWIRISSLGLRNKAYQYLALALILIVGFHTNTGSNEIYYNSVVPSLTAKALGSWALYYWLKEKYTLWIGLLVIAGYLQPLVGLQLFLLTSLALSFDLIFTKKFKELPWKPILIYLVLTVPWVYLLARHNGGHADPMGFINILEFRLSHHFFPSYFGWQHLVAAGVFAFITIRFFRTRLKWLMVFIVLGCLVYEIGVEKYHMTAILYTQWWKSTIWLEAFAFVVIAAGLEKLSPSPKFISKYFLIVPVAILILVSFYRLSGFFGVKPNYMLPWVTTKSDEADISEKAYQLTPEDAVFITPVYFSAFRWYSKRSTYVDYKALFHQESFLTEWYQRIQNIYAYGMKERKGGFDIKAFSKALLEEPSSISIDYWKKLGITHIISTSPDIKTLKLLVSNNTYSIYSLK
jgi:hypothetical protein